MTVRRRIRLGARCSWGLSRRSLKQTFRRPYYLAPILLFPSLVLAVNTGGADRAVELPGFPDVDGFLDFQLASAILQASMLAGLVGGIALALDVETGFIDRLVAAPIPRLAIVVGRLVAVAVMGEVAAVWFLGVALIFGVELQSGLSGALLILAATPVITVAFGTLWTAIALSSGRAAVVQGSFPLVFVALFLSSAFFPSNLLLQPAHAIASVNPISYVADALRNPIISELSLEPLAEGAGAITLLALVGTVASRAALRARVTST